MKFEIEVNENMKEITMSGQDLDISFYNSVYYSSGDLEKAMEEKVSPWMADCIQKARENKDKLINELLDEGTSITDIIYEAQTNETHIKAILLERYNTKNLKVC